MKFEIKLKKPAIKDIESLQPSYHKRIVEIVFKFLPTITNLNQISDCQKIKGYDKFYRIRVGDYRIGFELRDNQIVIYRIMHRKDIYKHFP